MSGERVYCNDCYEVLIVDGRRVRVCDRHAKTTEAGSGSSPTCGTCGRDCLPDGDCYGCEADRWIAKAAALEAGCATWRNRLFIKSVSRHSIL